MWPFQHKVRQRRLEVRRNIPAQRGALWRRFVKAGGPVNLAIAAAFFLLASALTVWPLEEFDYRVNRPAAKAYARVGFDAPDRLETDKARQDAANRVPVHYVSNDALLTEVQTQLLNLPVALRAVEDPNALPEELRKQFGLTSAGQLAALRVFADEPGIRQWESAVAEAVGRLGRHLILSTKDLEDDRRYISRWMVLHHRERETPAVFRDPAASVLDSRAVRAAADDAVEPLGAIADPRAAQAVRVYLINTIMAGRPIYRLDFQRTEEARAQAWAAEPTVMQHFPADSVIFPGGDVRVQPEDLEILQAEHWAWHNYRRQHDPSWRLRQVAGRAAGVFLVTVALAGYILLYQPRIVRNPLRATAMGALLLLMLALSKVMVSVGWNPYLAVGAATMGASIVTIAYDRRFALAVGALLSVLVVLMLRGNPGLLLVLMAPVTVSVLLLREIRTRSKVIEVGAFAAIAAFLAAGATQLAWGLPLGRDMPLDWRRLVADCGWAGGAVLAAGFIVQGILPAIERVFRVATSMTLLEWCDANKKLLKRLAIEAPGTYNHSLLLGTLCEAAAEAIGARGLLARVGAYYHDIGKINKPEYFVENQFDSPSKHAKLSPAMSQLIITGHVKDGIEMAREYGLPPVLHEFIAAHHGTTLVQYFYHAAAEQRRLAGGDRPPEEIEFRYPGPKPRSKEVAILMLADATESAVRAMSDPTPNRIEAQAHAIITARLMDGQLDECELKLREVHQIEDSLVKSLCGMYHGRIAYPAADQKGQPKLPAQPARA